MIGAKFFLKTYDLPLTTPFRRGTIYFVTPRLTLDIFYLHTKFGDFRLSRSGDMIPGVNIDKSPLPLTDPRDAVPRPTQKPTISLINW